jgi:hypothetical protein
VALVSLLNDRIEITKDERNGSKKGLGKSLKKGIPYPKRKKWGQVDTFHTFTVKSDYSLLTVFRHRDMVTLNGEDRTKLFIPATATAQSIVFENGIKMLVIKDARVMLDETSFFRDKSKIEWRYI